MVLWQKSKVKTMKLQSFQKMVLEQVDNHMGKKKKNLNTKMKINSKWTKKT